MISNFDHVVLTTIDKAKCVDFYTRVLGMQVEDFITHTGVRTALKFGVNKINIHERGKEFEPKAHLPVSGALDFCMIAAIPLDAVIEKLAAENWPILEGPTFRTGARGKIRSVYLRDPDLNLIEVSEYVSA